MSPSSTEMAWALAPSPPRSARWDGAALAVEADVGDEPSVERAFATIAEELGRPDILVNNAGIVTVSLLADMTTATFDEMLRIDLKSVFLCTRAVLPAMRARRYGRIVNISSQIAYKGALGMTHYAAAKAGILGFSRSLAYEVTRDGIAVNTICPGPLDTDMKLPPDWGGKEAVRAGDRPPGPGGGGGPHRPSAGLRGRRLLCRRDVPSERRRHHGLSSRLAPPRNRFPCSAIRSLRKVASHVAWSCRGQSGNPCKSRNQVATSTQRRTTPISSGLLL